MAIKIVNIIQKPNPAIYYAQLGFRPVNCKINCLLKKMETIRIDNKTTTSAYKNA